ncbi:hypothetical protein BB934_45070 (plasmid) [Microvirga ossetica]|uniref:Uncharacterized protein n=1 Tax=Microvirga ossetica TaxID=1882682 RepID=A0A1B2EZN0_9HYPH|nr:hypothetical protein [Microvirga ossetica]ANY85393.1 hypothetical protein BB934_45070 [Microvirga ossetica]
MRFIRDMASLDAASLDSCQEPKTLAKAKVALEAMGMTIKRSGNGYRINWIGAFHTELSVGPIAMSQLVPATRVS